METDSQRFSERQWSSPPVALKIARNQVHVWRATVESSDKDVAQMKVFLSPDEIERADRFFFERDRNRFITARGFLRIILSLYLNCTPGKLQFNYSEHGKPSLKSCGNDAAVNFNLAHSGTLAIYGITLKRALGVDIEQIRQGFAVEDLARSFFSADDAARLLSVPAEDRRQAFFNGWTRKEAFIKAKGQGLSLSLDQFDVTLSPGESPALLRTQWDASEASRWSLRTIDVAPGYAASIAVEGHDWELKCWQASKGIYRDLLPKTDLAIPTK